MKAEKKIEHFSLTKQVMHNKSAFIVFIVLRVIIVGIMIRCILLAQWESMFTCILALALMLIPPFVEKNFKLELPSTLEIIVFIFVFCAEILGELGSYYVKYSFWDTALHTTSGFIFAAVGFCIVDLLNRNTKIGIHLSPITLAIVAFCFSMTIGVLWEFFEYAADLFLNMDMQKDKLVSSIYTVALDPTQSNIVIPVRDITETVIRTSSGETIVLDGYLDIGIRDTMKDLFVNFIGAVVFSIIGYFHVKHRGKGKIAHKFIPKVTDNEQ